MHRFFVPPEQCRGDSLQLQGAEAHHALHVLRISPGERVMVLDGAGQRLLCEAGSADRHSLALSVLERNRVAPPRFQITLVQALPKGKVIEWIVEKATELGVSRIVPLLTERVVARLDPQEAGQKTAKWRLTAISALKQCGLPWLPRIDTPVTVEKLLAAREDFDLSLIASLQPGARHPRQVIAEYERRHHGLPSSVCVWVGPEGDFTVAEMDAARAAEALPITLGQNVLRAETAAIYCLAILNYELFSPR